jgi:hypothetical protein
MTPKEKAKELVNKFKDDLFEQRHVTIYTEDAILIALIAVNEVINYNNYTGILNSEYYSIIKYWQEVKQEIENL